MILFLSLVAYEICTSPLLGSTAEQRLPFTLPAGHFVPSAGQWFWSVPESKEKKLYLNPAVSSQARSGCKQASVSNLTSIYTFLERNEAGLQLRVLTGRKQSATSFYLPALVTGRRESFCLVEESEHS